MLIKCEKCASPLQVPDSAAGKKVRCPKCQNIMVASVPAVPEVLPVSPVPAPPPPSPPVEEPAVLPAAKDEEPADIDDEVDSEPHVTAARPGLSRRDDDDDDDDRRRPRRRRRSRREEPLARGERSSEDLQAIIGYQRKILWSILIYVLVAIFAIVFSSLTEAKPDFSVRLVFASIYVIYVGVVEYFVCNLAWKLYGPVAAIILAILFAVPCVNFLVLVGMNSGATSVIRFHGISVGFMGADPNQARPSRLYERRMLQREPVSDKKLYDRYFAEDDVFLDLPARVRRIFADFVGMPEKKMLPDDDLADLLGRRRKDELFGELEHEFRIKFTDDEIDDADCTIRAVTLLVQDRLDEQR